MSNYKNLLKFGGVFSVLGLVALAYNFIAMYDIVANCPISVKVQPCQAYNNWQLINQIGLVIVVLGLVFVIMGLVKRHYSKH